MLPLPGNAGLPATRSTSDRIFVFVNKRPVAFLDVTKVLCGILSTENNYTVC